MSHPVVTDPVLNHRHKGSKSKGLNFLSLPVILIMICAVGGLPVFSARLWAIDSLVHAHNNAIVGVLMVVGPFFLVAFVALSIFVFIRAGRRVELEPEA